MSESHIQVPDDSVGKKLRTWLTGSNGAHAEAVVLTLANATNEFIDPRFVSLSGSSITLAVTGSANVTGGTIGISGSSVTFSVTGSQTISGGTIGISGSSVSLTITGSVIQTGQWGALVSGSISGSQSGQWTVNVTGSGTNQAVLITGSVTVGTHAVTESGQWGVLVSGSISGSQSGPWTVNATGSISVTGSGAGSAIIVTGSVIITTGSTPHTIPILITGSSITLSVTGSTGNPTIPIGITGSSYVSGSVSVTGSGGGGAVVITGSVIITTGSTLHSLPVFITGSLYTFSVTGSTGDLTKPVGITGSSWVSGSVYVTGSINVTGSGVSPLPVSISGSITCVASGSGVYTYASSQMVTGSVNINNIVTVTPIISGSGIYTYASAVMVTGSVNLNTALPSTVSGSGVYTYASAQMVTGSININSSSAITGSINNWPSSYTVTPTVSGSGIYTQLSAIMVTGSINLNSSSAVTGSINNWPTVYASTQSGNWYTGLSGSWKDTVTTGGTFALITANSGASVIALNGTTKIKLFDIGFAPQSAGYHYFYFGVDTGSIQSRRILSCSGSLTAHQSYPFQRTSNAGDALYVYSTTAETGLCFDLSYIQE